MNCWGIDAPDDRTDVQDGPRRLKKRYDVVVVGSGPAGSVLSARLARAGLRVAVLERGKEHRAGSFPEAPGDLVKLSQLWRNGMRVGAADALFDLRVFDDLMVLTGCGVGGTSLINGWVSAMPAAEVMEDRRWPAELRNDPQWADDIDRVGDVVGTPTLPLDRSPRPVSAEPNYLDTARSSGAQVFASSSVSHVEATAHGWAVVVTDTAQPSVRRRVEADRVVLAAGALGSTEVLLRSRDAGLETSPMLGHRFAGNGDMIAWGVDEVGPGNVSEPGTIEPGTIEPVNPAATPPNRSDHWSVADVVHPGFVATLAPLLLAVSALLDCLPPNEDPGRIVGWLRSFLDVPFNSAVARASTTLYMAAGDSDAQVQLAGSGVDVAWPAAGLQRSPTEGGRRPAAAVRQLGGRPVHTSGNRCRLGNRPVSVHPLGGCVMGGDAGDGVVDHRGRVFAGPVGRHTHHGLYVTDGSVVPRSLGTDPSLTIAALAERTARLVLAELGLHAEPVEPRRRATSQRAEVPPQR